MEAARVLALAHALPARAQRDPTVGAAVLAAYEARVATAFWTSPDSLLDLARQAQAEPALTVAIGPDLATWPVAAVLARLAPVDTSGMATPPLGHPTPRLRAAFWFPAPGRDTVQPAPGRVSLFVLWDLEGLSCAEGGRFVTSRCFAPVAARVRRWLAQDSAAGLTVTIVAETGVGNLLWGRLTPAQQADRLRWFIQDYWHLPVTVAVQVPDFLALPAPDGRIAMTHETQIAQWASHGGDGDPGDLVLTDRAGRLLAITERDGRVADATVPFNLVLQWALHPRAGATAPTTSTSAPPAHPRHSPHGRC